MKLSRITILTLLLATFALALPAFAQDATAEATVSAELTMQTFASANGSTTVSFPANWVVKNTASADDPLSISLANSPAAMDKDLFNRDDVFNAGEVHIEVAVIELTELAKSLPSGTITSNSTPLEILQALIKQGMPDTFTFGNPGAITINNNPAVRMNLTTTKRGEGQLLLTVYNKKWIAGIILFAAPGEGDKWDIIAREILASIKFDMKVEVTPEATDVPTVESTADAFALTQTAKTQNGLSSLMYPVTWFSRQYGKESLYVSNSEVALNKSFGSKFEPGQVNMLFSMSTTEDYIKQAQLNLKPDVTPLELLQGSLKAAGDTIKFGAPEATTVGDKLAARVDFNGEGFEGIAWLIEYQKGATVAVQMLTSPGESQRWENAALAIAQSISSTD